MSSDFAAPKGNAAPFGFVHYGLLALAAALHGTFVVSTWSEAYIDFGDGNYLYIAQRIREGAVVYRDILAPQPPCHLFLGALLLQTADLLGLENPLFFIRGFSLVLHFATFALLVVLAARAWGSATSATVAGVIFLALPLDTWWSMAYQSEPLEIFFLLAMMLCALEASPRRDVLAGIFGALAALTNATAAPFLLVLIFYMALANPKRALRLGGTALAIAAVVTAALELWTGGYFLRNVVLNQAGTYPSEDLFDYILFKLRREGGDILYLEGIFIVFALLGFFRFLRDCPLAPQARSGLAWFLAATLGSFLYVTKGGTVDYIFCLAGPAVALLAGGELTALGRRILSPWAAPSNGDGEGGAGSRVNHVALKLLGLLWALPVAYLFLAAPAHFYTTLWDQSAFELPDRAHAEALASAGGRASNVEQVREWIETYSEPGDTILAPPFYAFITGRNLWGDYSEIFIWTIKDHNDRQAHDPEGEGWRKTKAMAKAIRNKELPLVIIERDQTGNLPEVRAALALAYDPIIAEPYPTLNTRLEVFVPRPDPAP